MGQVIFLVFSFSFFRCTLIRIYLHATQLYGKRGSISPELIIYITLVVLSVLLISVIVYGF